MKLEATLSENSVFSWVYLPEKSQKNSQNIIIIFKNPNHFLIKGGFSFKNFIHLINLPSLFMMKLDKWQEDILAEEGNIVLRSGRQVGKSTIISIKAAEYAVKTKKASIMIIASVERQAYELLQKTLDHLYKNYRKYIKKGKDRPTKHEVKLTNGSIIRSLPTGQTGYGIRGYTINLLIADEAAFIHNDVWAAVTPALATTGGKIILLSTPNVKEGYYYERFNDPQFKAFHINSEKVAEGRPEPMRTHMLEFREAEKLRMTKAEYAREYLGEFADNLMQFFSDDLIRRAMQLKRPTNINPKSKYYLGVDIARLGKDLSTFEIVERKNDQLKQVENQVTSRTYLNQTTEHILKLDSQYNFSKIYIDDGGIGVGVFDYLLSNPQTKRKVVAINNATRILDRFEQAKKKLLKEDLYNNLLRLMEQNKIRLLDDDNIFVSLKSVHYEYSDGGTMLISGVDTHIAEGLIRAAWCVSSKNLSIWVTFM